MNWPRVIRKYGELFRFKEEKPGWLVYENAESFVLVGRQEAVDLADTDERAEGGWCPWI